MVKKYIHISFTKPFFINIYDLYFYQLDNNLMDYNYQNYEYKLQIDYKIYIFRGSFRDNYFLITSDVYDISHDNTIFNKNIILIKLDWELNSKNIYNIKINDNQILSKNCIVSPLRKDLNNNETFSIDELLDIKENYISKCKIKYSNNVKKSLHYLYSLFF